MHQKKKGPSYDFLRNDTYDSLKDQLQMQNQALLRERSRIQQGDISRPTKKHKKSRTKNLHSQQNILERSQQSEQDDRYRTSYFNQSEAGNVTNRIRRKIGEVIQLCNEDGRVGDSDFKDIIEAQKQILRYLQGAQNPDSIHYEKKLSRSKMQRVEDSHKKSIREELTSNGFNHLVSDDLMEMIEEIERKTLLEIQSLRMDKIMLLKKLNQETNAHNEEKRKRISLERKLKQLQYQSERPNAKKIASFPFERNNKIRNYHQYGEIAEESDEGSETVSEQSDEYEYEDEQEEYQYVQPKSKSTIQSRSKTASERPQNLQRSRQTHQQRYHQNSRSQQKQQHRQQPAKPMPRPKVNSYQDPNTRTRPIAHGSQNKIQQQIMRLSHQNQRLKQNLSVNGENSTLKQQLKSELAGLQNRIKNYETIIQNKSTANTSDVQSLLMNGNSLLNNTHQLMKSRSKTDVSPQNSEYLREMNFLQEKMNKLREQNKNLSYQGFHTPYEGVGYKIQSPGLSKTPKARSVSHNYQSIIQEMRRANQS